MKVIDLLNKIANGEVKHNTKFRIYFSDKLHRDFYYDWYETCPLLSLKAGNGDLFQDDFDWNDEVEIIEEEPRDIEVCGTMFTRSEYNKLAGIKEDKKIEQIYYADLYTQDIHSLNDHINEHFNEVYNKINELIDEINKLKEKE